MGLDVCVYNNIKLLDINDDDDDYDYDFKAFVIDPEWEYKIKNLKLNGFYKGKVVYRGNSYSYSTHNRFREELIKLIDRPDLLNKQGRIEWDKLESGIPFYEFIHFADNEGCLDWEISEKLSKEFETYDEKAKEFFVDDKYAYRIYHTWHKTFNIAKNKGVVVYR